MRRHLLLFSLLCLMFMVGSCQREAAPQPPKRYSLRGKVVSIDKNSNSLVVSHESIPNFMSAMTMPYIVKPASRLDLVSPGDMITADVLIQEDRHAYWLENIVVIEHAKAPPSKATTAP